MHLMWNALRDGDIITALDAAIEAVRKAAGTDDRVLIVCRSCDQVAPVGGLVDGFAICDPCLSKGAI